MYIDDQNLQDLGVGVEAYLYWPEECGVLPILVCPTTIDRNAKRVVAQPLHEKERGRIELAYIHEQELVPGWRMLSDDPLSDGKVFSRRSPPLELELR